MTRFLSTIEISSMSSEFFFHKRYVEVWDQSSTALSARVAKRAYCRGSCVHLPSNWEAFVENAHEQIKPFRDQTVYHILPWRNVTHDVQLRSTWLFFGGFQVVESLVTRHAIQGDVEKCFVNEVEDERHTSVAQPNNTSCGVWLLSK